MYRCLRLGIDCIEQSLPPKKRCNAVHPKRLRTDSPPVAMEQVNPLPRRPALYHYIFRDVHGNVAYASEVLIAKFSKLWASHAVHREKTLGVLGAWNNWNTIEKRDFSLGAVSILYNILDVEAAPYGNLNPSLLRYGHSHGSEELKYVQKAVGH